MYLMSQNYTFKDDKFCYIYFTTIKLYIYIFVPVAALDSSPALFPRENSFILSAKIGEA